MSYQVLARKYRPRNFETLVGQEHVVRALSHALRTQRLHHAYLFTGTRGVGKTTLSRILAKSLNCTGPDGQGGVTAEPCGQCEACVAIDGGRFVDYIEMDAASNRGVDEMAQLLEQAIYAPSNARFKVYMIDEVHMLTNHAFNAMLKTLEEPPPHIKFILATTDPQKIPVTVLSRCLQFNLKQMPPGHIIGHLENILGQEGIGFEQPALRLLAQGAHGSMRDALSLTDQAIAYAAGQVTLEAVQGMLGALDQSFLVRLLDALARNDGADLMAVADEMASRSLSYNAALQDLATLLHRVALAQSVPAAVPEDLPEYADILRLAELFDPQEVQLYYQIAVHGRNEMGLAPDEYAGFSMTLLRMLAFRPENGAAAGGGAKPTGPATAGQARSMAGEARAAAMAAAGAARPAARPAPQAAAPAPAPVAAAPAPAPMAAAPAPAPVAEIPAPAPLAAAPVPAPADPVAVAPAAPVPAPSAEAAPAAAAPLSPARAAIQAALEAARAASRGKPGAGAISGATPRPAPAPAPVAAPPAAAPVARAAAPAAQDEGDVVAEAPPWDLGQAEAVPDDEPPAWATGFPEEAQAAPAAAPVARAPAAPRTEHVIAPLPAIGWNGNWPELAAGLPLRGVAQQLAVQTELVSASCDGHAAHFKLRVPVDTLRASGNTEKLAAALQERFPEVRVNLEIEIGPVWHTASAFAQAAREARQRAAEELVERDPFVQDMMRLLGASVIPGSVKPPETA
ncbi:DNA polymerase III subunit gamma/tau [Massilia sp. TS11]|uniref:DNA polymerase III subunit gamma/tau n=1 Tax=Massilia sp. TS11 TaxID=2908003 RepID=UPI001EDACEE2|nr:DNA polymerase III subunit gamma/tau [Massilia sp. TS11]MCG2586126.1 DNA polymerase III subunit gamma/tau [Massilia sp. TS11]